MPRMPGAEEGGESDPEDTEGRIEYPMLPDSYAPAQEVCCYHCPSQVALLSVAVPCNLNSLLAQSTHSTFCPLWESLTTVSNQLCGRRWSVQGICSMQPRIYRAGQSTHNDEAATPLLQANKERDRSDERSEETNNKQALPLHASTEVCVHHCYAITTCLCLSCSYRSIIAVHNSR